MNYQPFLEMNLLVSDQLLSELHKLFPTIIFSLVLCFYFLMYLHLTLFSLYKVLRQPRKRPYAIGANDEA